MNENPSAAADVTIVQQEARVSQYLKTQDDREGFLYYSQPQVDSMQRWTNLHEGLGIAEQMNGPAAIPDFVLSFEELCRVDPAMREGMEFFASIYEEHKAEGAPSWEEMRPRVEKRVVHLYNKALITDETPKAE